MDVPNQTEVENLLARILRSKESDARSVLAPEDEAYLASLIALVKSGKKAVLIVEDEDERLKYMFSSATRAEAVSILGKVVEATGRRISEEG